MNQLIPIHNESDAPTVLGRDLHKFLEVKTAYKDWFPRMCEYGFAEGADFNQIKNERVQNEGGRMVSREIVEHQLTITMAKEICMIQRSEKGKMARQYFIQLESAWNKPEMVMARALKMADKQIAKLKEENDEMKPLAAFAKTCLTSKDNVLVRELAKLCKSNGIDVGEHRLYAWMRNRRLLMRGNEPYQRYIESGFFVIEQKPYDTPYGVRLTRTTKVTPRGQAYIIKRLEKEKQNEAI